MFQWVKVDNILKVYNIFLSGDNLSWTRTRGIQ